MDDEFDRRMKLADWMTAPDNPFFARNIVNRFWGYTMGRGLVEPLDDMRATNPASNPGAARRAGRTTSSKHKFNLKHLLRTIFNSPGLSARSVDDRRRQRGRRARTSTYTRYTVRRLTAEQTGRRPRFRHRHAREVPGPAARHAGDPVARHAR